MKKIVAFVALAMAFSAGAFAADSPVKFSLFDKIAAPASEDINFGLGLVYSNTQRSRGLDLTIFASRVEDMGGVQLGFLYSGSKDMGGAQLGLINHTEGGYGLQWGAVNLILGGGKFSGVSLGLVNYADAAFTGLQWGAVNYAKSFKGLQLGIVNYAERMESGLQIGLANIIRENGWLPVMIIVNGKF